jgi:hypothetical protein
MPPRACIGLELPVHRPAIVGLDIRLLQESKIDYTAAVVVGWVHLNPMQCSLGRLDKFTFKFNNYGQASSGLVCCSPITISYYMNPNHLSNRLDYAFKSNIGSRVGLAQLIRFLVVELNYSDSNSIFDMSVIFITNYSFSRR